MNLLEKRLKNWKIELNITDKHIKEKLAFLEEKPGDESIIITDKAESEENAIYVYKISLSSLFRFIKNIERSIFYKGLILEFPDKLISKETERIYLSLFFIFLFLTLFIKIYSLIPMDDLLRHLVSYKFGYDYTKIFIHTDLPSWNVHITYEILTGFIYHLFSLLENETIQIIGPFLLIDYLMVGLLGLGIWLNVKDKSPIVYILLFSLIFSQIAGRVFLGRPTILAMVLFILSIGLYKVGKKWLGLFVASLMSIFYYLFFIYIIPLAVFYKKKAIIPFVIGLSFWSTYAYIKGGNYLLDIYRYVINIDFEKIPVLENATLFSAISSPVFIIMLIVIFLYWKKVEKQYFYSSLFFYLSNQIRYIEIILPLTAISIKNIIEEFYKKVLKEKKFLAFLLSISLVLSNLKVGNSNPKFDEDICKLIENKKVFTLPGDNFRIIYNCAGYNIKLSPAMEPRWSDEIYMKLYHDISKRKFSCKNDYVYEYDYIYESFLKGYYECLELEYVDGEYRLWRIKKLTKNQNRL